MCITTSFNNTQDMHSSKNKSTNNLLHIKKTQLSSTINLFKIIFGLISVQIASRTYEPPHEGIVSLSKLHNKIGNIAPSLNGPCFGDGDLWCVENLCEDELCSSESKSYRQGICDAIIKSMKGNVSSSEQEWSSTSLDLGASFSTTRNPFVWRTDFTNNHNKSSSLISNISYGPTRFSVNEYEVFCVSKTDIADVPINSKKFRRGKKRLTLVEKYHTPMDKEGWWECN
ncbi:13165_t:CDS:2 [Funneliformis caledonium]|uniref:13165_t:CDS:1 n=1 Tax=Funneliformis caledonium TaxID=1117310 RepID=A0A9N8WIA0_9GLOM|nr:13165_t:CDS:2 [Funneliformis caledonium]